MPEIEYALSIKQPWATLLVNGIKTIEIRSWPTRHRGIVYVHAARQPVRSESVWKLVPESLKEQAHHLGGIIGVAELIACRTYETQLDFARDRDHHCCDPSVFRRPLYGFVFANAHPVPFHPCPGWLRFFRIDHKGRRGK
ncbi:MAG: hypothetical protein KatS3mg105_0915 [Gemmatales bacterium]|nr:MAG: hypothetical protein KatS3mg105_0915 [Gemmatales bacterium]